MHWRFCLLLTRVVGALYHKLLTRASAPEDGRNYRPKHVELIEIINKFIMVASSWLFILLYQWCPVIQTSRSALLFHDRGTRRRWVVSSTPRLHFTPGKEPVPILQGAGWAPGPVWTGRKSRPRRDSIPDCPACSQSLYRLSYQAHNFVGIWT